MDKSVPIKMVMRIFRDSIVDDVLSLLKQFGVKAFTEMHHVDGLGETGAVFHFFIWPGTHPTGVCSVRPGVGLESA